MEGGLALKRRLKRRLKLDLKHNFESPYYATLRIDDGPIGDRFHRTGPKFARINEIRGLRLPLKSYSLHGKSQRLLAYAWLWLCFCFSVCFASCRGLNICIAFSQLRALSLSAGYCCPIPPLSHTLVKCSTKLHLLAKPWILTR